MKEESTLLESKNPDETPAESLSKALQWATNPRGGNNFYGRVLNGTGRQTWYEKPTCAVTITTKGRYVLLWHPDWFVKQTRPFQLMVLVHEAAHLILGHLERGLKLTRNMDKNGIQRLMPVYNVAMDMAANDVSVRPMLDNPNYKFKEYREHFILPEQRNYPKNRTFEEYLSMLMDDLEKHGFNNQTMQQRFQQATGQPDPNQPPQQGGGQPDPNQQGGGGNQNDPNSQQQKDQGGGSGKPSNDLDDSFPQWFKNLVDQSHAPVNWVMDFSEMTEAEVERALSRSKREAKRIATSAVQQSKGRGTVPAEIKAAVEGLMEEPTIPWTEVLKGMARSQVSSKLGESTAYPNPAFFNVEGIEPYPGFQKEFSFVIHAHIDTSGSVSNEQFKEFIREIRGIVRDVDGVTVYLGMFDTAIQKISILDEDSELELREGLNRYGYGGTSFGPSLKYSCKRDDESDWVSGVQDDPDTPNWESPDLVIMFTDGYAPVEGPLPEYKPACPLMWCLTSNGNRHALMEPLVLEIEE